MSTPKLKEELFHVPCFLHRTEPADYISKSIKTAIREKLKHCCRYGFRAHIEIRGDNIQKTYFIEMENADLRNLIL